jgi:uncharacterized protein YukE
VEWPVLAPVLTVIGAAFVRFVWQEGRSHQKIRDICKELDQIRDELRGLRADLRMNDWQKNLSTSRARRREQ